jgi:argininosuccinate lyase
MTDMHSTKPWGGRFSEATDAFMEAFSASVGFDKRLYRHDITASMAHADMLAHVKVITDAERQAIHTGLTDILADIERGDFAWTPQFEDVHMNIEARLIQRIGDVAKKLHTARSRNDQVATDMRLYLRDEIDRTVAGIAALQTTLLDVAEREADTIMPGFTHMQVAQPVSFGHHMMAWFEMLQRDRARFRDCRGRVNVMPLGAAALAGTGYPIDRARVARALGFDAVAENSMDAVSDRDFVIEFVHAAAVLMMHLSRFSEEIILWASPLFDFIDIPDRFCTGSSIMPQKKNPDGAELVRGKTGRVYGHLMALLTLMKGQPLAYNRDNQEDKEPMFDTADTITAALRVYTEMLPAITVKRGNLQRAVTRGFATATDLADYLVRKGVPFRDAHEIVGRTVRHAVDKQKDLNHMTLDELRSFSPVIDVDVFTVLTPEGSLASRNHIGGTAPEQVRAAVERARRSLGGITAH